MNIKRSKSHFPEQILAISYEEIENSLGREFSILSSWCKKEYGKFTQFLNSGNFKKAEMVWKEVFISRKDDFIKVLKAGKKDTRAEEFVADSFFLAAILKNHEIMETMSFLKDDNCVNSNIFFQKARYYAVTDHKEEMLSSIRDCLIMGLSKDRFLQDEIFQPLIEDSNFIGILEKYHKINNEVQKAIETSNIQTFENLLSLIPSFLTMQILTPKGFAAYLPQAAAWHLCQKEDLQTIDMMQKIIQRTPNAIIGECLVNLASENEYLEPFSFILECGANPNTQNKEGYTALGRAKGNGCGKIITYLTKSDKGLSPKLAKAIEEGIQKFSLEHGDKTVTILAIEDGTLSFGLDGEDPNNSGSWKYQGFYEFSEEVFDLDAYEAGKIDPDSFNQILDNLNQRGIFNKLNKTENFKYLFLGHIY
ncbi:ankyrin repeat domain-containing protein [Leptospira noguchii]|uniref:ankyrin repeat domain-containing protein n=1 Tax=Leptospira noguchii TaxID=28182 RepID=UPI001FB74E1B|nr:ankyrin repeat domain-containing protein [Leptospira noguchii]UOG33433.1 ankyrin repeat domain-containing protein [Leptospira noguchii]UOG44264.1 ankyrin repeat domain-containing protein [Leptospira noguchii]